MSLLIPFSEQYLPAFGKNSRRFFLWGIILFVLGCLAISAAAFTTLLSVVFLGFVIFFSGAVMAIDSVTFWWGKWNGFLIHILLAILYLGIGVMLIQNPIEGSVSLTLLLGIFYIIAGIFRIAFSSTLRVPRWGWGWFNGLITLILGILILTSWPASSLFIIGLFVGIDLLFAGWTYMMLGAAGKKLLK
jgi:uncharacterized membrane protein HdeD (DUF308 family)